MTVLGHLMMAAVAIAFLVMLFGFKLNEPKRKPKEVIDRRSTVTRVVIGGIIAGPVGAIAGYAAKKKVKQ